MLDVAIRSVVGENRAVPSPERRHSYRGTPSLSSDAFGILWKNSEQAATLAEVAWRSQNLLQKVEAKTQDYVFFLARGNMSADPTTSLRVSCFIVCLSVCCSCLYIIRETSTGRSKDCWLVLGKEEGKRNGKQSARGLDGVDVNGV